MRMRRDEPVKFNTLDQPLGVLFGADSLKFRRSGIGRMTAQILEELRHAPDVAALRLLLGWRAAGPELLDRLPSFADDAAPKPPGPAQRARQALRAGLTAVPGAPATRRFLLRAHLARQADRIRACCDGRVVYHEPNMIPRPFDGPTVITVNDLSWHADQRLHPRDRVAWIERHLSRSLAQATRFVAVSRFTADEMVRHLGIARERIDVVPLAPAACFGPLDAPSAEPLLRRFGLADRGFVLSVSTLEPRKNFDRLLAAHSALPQGLRRRLPLVIAGGRGWGMVLADEWAARAQREGTLRLLGHVTDAELRALYARCTVFAFPSLYEGFGLPIIEAMASGAPVLASATTATGETAGTAARLVNPLDVADIAEGLREVAEDEVLAAALRAAGQKHAANYSWARTARGLIESWQRALQPAAPRGEGELAGLPGLAAHTPKRTLSPAISPAE